jgi:hypothetical protein
VADYYPLIARAAGGADTESRCSIYDRARAAQSAHLRKVDPPLSEEEISRERLALEEAIRRVEREMAGAPRIDGNRRGEVAASNQQATRAPVAPEPSVAQKPRIDPTHRSKNSRIKKDSATNDFDLLFNPFVLLRVTPYSTAVEIKQAYEDAVEDEIAPTDVLQRAQQALLTPKLRTDAEVAGFLDVQSELARRTIAKLEERASWSELQSEFGSLHALPRSNVLAHLGSQSPFDVGELLLLLEAQATVAIGGVYDAVIEARERAGAGRVDRDTIAEALVRLEDRQVKAVVNALAGTSTFAETFTAFVKRVLANQDASQLQKLDTYIRAYNHAAASEISRRREKVLTACDALRSDPKSERAIEQISGALRQWNAYGQPLQLFESHMHREDAQARELYLHVRDLCLWLANDKEQFDTARKITHACAEVFKELPRAIGQMKEESDVLDQLHNQQTAAKLLEPLGRVYEEAQQNHRVLEREILRSGFGPASKGVAKKLYDTFSEAVRSTSTTDVADLPWRLLRNVAISLNNESRAPRAAAALIGGLIQFFGIQRPSADVRELLENDERACTKNIIQADLEASLSAGQLSAAAEHVDKLLALEKDSDEQAALQKMRSAIAERRRSKNIKIGFWVAAGAVVLLLVVTNQDNRPSYSPSSPQRTVDRPSQVSLDEDRPPIGSGQTFSRANIRYCQFQGVRLEALRSMVMNNADVSRFNALINDLNARCGQYRYRPSDKSAVDTELVSRRAALEAEGRAIAYTWR